MKKSAGSTRFNRRMFFTVASAGVAATRTVFGQQTTPAQLPRVKGPLVWLNMDQKELDEFQRQARDFAAAVKAAGKSVQLLVGEGYNHFEIIETLANPYGLCGRAVLEQMRLTSA